MAATGIFTTLTLAQVQAIQTKAVALITEGKTVMNYSDSGTSVGKQFPMPLREVLEECNYALAILDPDTYGPAIQARTISSRYNRHPFTH